MWYPWDVKMDDLSKLCGSLHKSKRLDKLWTSARKVNQKPNNDRSLKDIQREVLDGIEQVIEKTTVGSQHDDIGLLVVVGWFESKEDKP